MRRLLANHDMFLDADILQPILYCQCDTDSPPPGRMRAHVHEGPDPTQRLFHLKMDMTHVCWARLQPDTRLMKEISEALFNARHTRVCTQPIKPFVLSQSSVWTCPWWPPPHTSRPSLLLSSSTCRYRIRHTVGHTHVPLSSSLTHTQNIRSGLRHKYINPNIRIP
jgi:hypothetical protein